MYNRNGKTQNGGIGKTPGMIGDEQGNPIKISDKQYLATFANIEDDDDCSLLIKDSIQIMCFEFFNKFSRVFYYLKIAR